WLDGDAFLYTTADNVCLCTTALHEGAVATFLMRLFEKAKVPPHYRNFFLTKVADVGSVARLHREGVREIEIRASLYKASVDYVRRRTEKSLIGGDLERK